MIETVAVLVALFGKGVLWGIGENRQFYDHGLASKKWIGHLSTYHGWLFYFFALLNAGLVNGLPLPLEAKVILFVIAEIADILVLDVTWWVNRFMDITFLGRVWYLGKWAIWTFPEKNFYDGGKGARWHRPEDWDAAGLPLWLGTYSWWWISAAAITLLSLLLMEVIGWI